MKRTNVYDPKRVIFRRGILTILVSLLLMSCVVACLLHMYRVGNEKIFHTLVEENLTASHRVQVEKFQRTVVDTEDLLEAIATVYRTSQQSPESAWSASYLEAIRQMDALYDVRFFTAESLRGRFQGPDKTYVEQLLRGRPVVSEVFYSERMGGVCVFSVAVPVEQNGEIIGAFRCVLLVDDLLQSAGKNDFDHTDAYLLLSNGEFVAGPEGYVDGQHMLLEELAGAGISEAELARVQTALQEGHSDLITLHDRDESRTYLMVSSLGYQDWTLLSVAHSAEVEAYASPIMRNTSLLVAALLLLLLLLLSSAFWLFWQQRQRTLHSQARYDLLAQFSDTILFEYDCQRKTLVFTPNIAARFNIQALETLHPFDKQCRFTVVHPEDVPLLKGVLQQAESMTGDQTESVTLRFLDRDGVYRWMGLQGQVLRDEGGVPLVLVGKLSDVHEQRSKEQRLIEKSSIDAMTGALNRETTRARIEKQLAVSEAGFLFMLDVDDFKSINDSFGHSAGDRLLMNFVEAIKGAFRQEDVVGRIGGDEFVIYMSNTGSVAAARQRAEDLLHRLKAWQDPLLTASIGIAAFPANGSTYEELYEAADAAMYRAKRHGKSAYCFADAGSEKG